MKTTKCWPYIFLLYLLIVVTYLEASCKQIKENGWRTFFMPFLEMGSTLNGVGTIWTAVFSSWFIQTLPVRQSGPERNGHKGYHTSRFWVCFFFFPHWRTFIDFRERGREEERERENIDVREKHRSVASHTRPDWGSNPQPRHVPWSGIEPVTFQFTGWCSNDLSHTGQRSSRFILAHQTCNLGDKKAGEGHWHLSNSRTCHSRGTAAQFLSLARFENFTPDVHSYLRHFTCACLALGQRTETKHSQAHTSTASAACDKRPLSKDHSLYTVGQVKKPPGGLGMT